MSLPFDAAAQCPVGLTVSRARFARYNSRGAARRILHRVAASLPGPVVAWWLAFLWIPWLGLAIRRWAHARKQLAEGALTPVVVLDASRGLCAAYSDLSYTNDVATPVVKIYQERLDLVDPARVKDGQRFAAASLFVWPDNAESTDWSDFTPTVVDCLCDDAAGCAEALERVPAEEWAALEAGLESLGVARSEPGLHRLPKDLGARGAAGRVSLARSPFDRLWASGFLV